MTRIVVHRWLKSAETLQWTIQNIPKTIITPLARHIAIHNTELRMLLSWQRISSTWDKSRIARVQHNVWWIDDLNAETQVNIWMLKHTNTGSEVILLSSHTALVNITCTFVVHDVCHSHMQAMWEGRQAALTYPSLPGLTGRFGSGSNRLGPGESSLFACKATGTSDAVRLGD